MHENLGRGQLWKCQNTLNLFNCLMLHVYKQSLCSKIEWNHEMTNNKETCISGRRNCDIIIIGRDFVSCIRYLRSHENISNCGTIDTYIA